MHKKWILERQIHIFLNKIFLLKVSFKWITISLTNNNVAFCYSDNDKKEQIKQNTNKKTCQTMSFHLKYYLVKKL